MAHGSINHHHNNTSIINAIPLLKNLILYIEVIDIKYFIPNNKQFLQASLRLREGLLKYLNNCLSQLLKADKDAIYENKLLLLNEALDFSRISMNYINELGKNNLLKTKQAMHIAKNIHEIENRINRWIKYIKTKSRNEYQ